MVRKAEVEANKRLHDEGQKYTTILAKVVPLHAEIVTLKDVAAANQVKMTNLEARSITREVLLGKVKADLAGKNEALEKLKAELAMLLEKSKEELAEKPLLKLRRRWLPRLRTSKRSRQNSLTTLRMPMPRGSKMLCLRLFVNTLRWTLRTLILATISSKDRSCRGSFPKIPLSSCSQNLYS